MRTLSVVVTVEAYGALCKRTAPGFPLAFPVPIASWLNVGLEIVSLVPGYRMQSLWSFVAKPKNREVLGWIGGGAVALAAGAWAVVTYVWPAHEPGKTACVQQGIIVGGNVSGSTVSNKVTGSSVGQPCIEPSEPK
jgi:hypothetical protein